MNNKSININWRIFRKATTRTLTDREQIIFNNWLNACPENKTYYDKAVSYYKNNDNNDIDYSLAFKQFKKHSYIKNNKSLHWLQAVASIVFLISITWILSFWLTNTSGNKISNNTSPKKIKANSVELTLSTGKRIALNKKKTSVIKEKTATIIQKNDIVNYHAKQKQNKKQQYNTIKVPKGTDFKLILSDSSFVWLNAESKITYPITFSKKNRKVKISGEAYLIVKHDTKRPFIVETQNTEVKVLGTEFNINTYSNTKGTITSLVKGSVTVKNKNGKHTTLKPNQQVISKNGELYITTANLDKVLSWQKGIFNFEDQPLDEILKELSHWYDFKVIYNDSELKKLLFTGNLKRYDDMNKLLELFQMTKAVQFKINNKTLIIEKPNKKQIKSLWNTNH